MQKIIEAKARITAEDKTRDGFKSVAQRAEELQRKMARFAAQARQLERAAPQLRAMANFDRHSKAVERFAAAQAAAGAGMAALGRAAGPAAAVAVAGKAYKRFADVERTMTRIGITADASAEETRAAFADAQKAALDFAMPVDKIVEGMGDLAAQGKNMGDIRAQIRAIAATAQASGSEVVDIAKTAGTLQDQLKITSKDMQNAFDIMVAGGKAGKFELKDMARYLPSLGPAFAALGYKGEEGLKRLVATAQVVRAQTGTAEEAASSLNNIFAKMESEQTVTNFKKMGVDLRAEMAKARKDGKDLLEVFVALSRKALKGDLSKLPQLFTDMEFARGMRALLSSGDGLQKMLASLGNAGGSTMSDLNRVLKDNKTATDTLAASWDKLLTKLGERVAPGISPVLDRITKLMDGDNKDNFQPNVVRPGQTPISVPTSVKSPVRTLTDYKKHIASGSDLSAEMQAQERAALAGMAQGRASERATQDSRNWYERNVRDKSIMGEDLLGANAVQAYRDAARKSRGITPGQSIAVEQRHQGMSQQAVADFKRANAGLLVAGKVPDAEWKSLEAKLTRIEGVIAKGETGRGYGDGRTGADRAASIIAELKGGAIKAVVEKPVDVTGKLDPVELKGQANVNVTVRVQGEGRVTGLGATSSGHIKANVGTAMKEMGVP